MTRWAARPLAGCVWFASLGQVQAQHVFGHGFEESCQVDSDGDRLSNCEEVVRSTDYDDFDTDNDGLSDGDEVLGTLGGLELPAFGVDPLHKDLLVEMDWDSDSRGCPSHSHRPHDDAIAEARIFYAAAPVPNPDGLDGINLIADYGQGPAPFTGGNEVDYPNGVTGDLQIAFHAVKSANFDPKRNGYFRYQAHAHYWEEGNGSSGVGDIWGDNSAVTVNCSWNDSDSVRNTIIHELGHNLGLNHGGGSACNGLPNYNSLMNYKHQFHGIDTDCDQLPDGIDSLGYSRGDRTPLMQGSLNESQGVAPWVTRCTRRSTGTAMESSTLRRWRIQAAFPSSPRRA